MSQGKLIAKYPNAHVIKQPGQDLLVYRVLKLNRSTSYGPLRPLLEDDNLEEVMFNNPAKPVMVYHRKHGMCVTNISMTEEEAVKVIQKIAAYVGRKIGMENLLLDGRLPDGSRVNATLPPASPGGPTLTIRKQTQDPLTFVDLIGFGTLTPRLAALLWMFVDGMGAAPCNILVSGGTASGKTSTLNVLGLFIPSQVRLITIEDVSEIQLLHEHHVQLETVHPAKAGDPGLDMDALLKNTLRMRPDRLIVGEVRGAEARTLFTAMNTGHDGCMGTVHANTAQESV
ncbi:MAG TPA: CpaF family protein, partial [Candidatus Poseidoniales archaeon]|nr:CpaF family protein [Candidatus Poseidoniales archaeon]